MDISISDSLPSQPTVPSTSTDPAKSLEGDATDSVRLSEEAQIRLRVQQGESPEEIAVDLGVAAMTVMMYLDVAPPPAPPIPEPQNGPSLTVSIPAILGICR
jgi:hypothetical protein